jgi:hypothetical protein
MKNFICINVSRISGRVVESLKHSQTWKILVCRRLRGVFAFHLDYSLWLVRKKWLSSEVRNHGSSEGGP